MYSVVEAGRLYSKVAFVFARGFELTALLLKVDAVCNIKAF